MQQVKVIYTQDSDNCLVDNIRTQFKGDTRILAKLLNEAYTAAGAEVLAIHKIEEVEIGLM